MFAFQSLVYFHTNTLTITLKKHSPRVNEAICIYFLGGGEEEENVDAKYIKGTEKI